MVKRIKKVKTKSIETSDPRIGKILDFIVKLASGDQDHRETPSEQGDEIDGIIIGLNMLAEELSHQVISLSQAETRMDEIIEVIIAIASLDYNRRAPITDKGDTFDAIAYGLNALVEELQISTISKDYLDNIIQSMRDILVVLTPDINIRTVNRAAVELLGYKEPELIGQSFEKIFDKNDFIELDFGEIVKKEGFQVTETKFLAKDGRKVPVSLSGAVMRGKNGGSSGIVCVAHDITEQKLLEEERRKRQDRLVQLGQLAGGIGHELRNPLGAIKNSVYFLDMVLEEAEPDVKETLKILDKEVTNCERTISSLLDFARAKPPLKRKVSIKEIIRDALSYIEIPGNIEVNILEAESMPIISCDPYQLGQVFSNIMLNAVQAMSAGGRLLIQCAVPEPDWMEISFQDTGVGIPKENIDKIFTPLFTSKAKGIGLGMAITRAFVEGHGGSINVASEPGTGSTFTVRLPIREKEGTDEK